VSEQAELLALEQRELDPGLTELDEIERLLELSARLGFVRPADDPCARILPFEGGGSYPVQYTLDHAGHHYYLRWRYGFSIDVDNEGVLEGDLETTTTNEWTFRETTVILAIVSDAILRGAPLSELEFPDSPAAYAQHPHYHLGRAPLFCFPDDFVALHGTAAKSWCLELRDFGRWYALWNRRQQRCGVDITRHLQAPSCACGVPHLTCGVGECQQAHRTSS
jgi:hypothetical protein